MRCVLELTSCTQSWPICTHGGAEAASNSTPVAPPTMSVMQAAAYSLRTEETQPKVLPAVQPKMVRTFETAMKESM